MKSFPAVGRFVVVLILLAILLVLRQTNVYSVISSCTANVSPSGVDNNTTNSTFFAITNNGSTTVNWIYISTPNGSFTVAGGVDAGGWSPSTTESSLTLTGGSLAAGDSQTVAMQVTAVSSSPVSGNWTVNVSDDGGATSTSCGGALTQSIAASAPTGPSMSNLVVSNVTDSSVSVSWDTDQSADSAVDYGTTTAYGSNKSDSSQVTSHSLSVSDLSANTVYHYNVTSSNGNGSTSSGDNTFTTAKSGYTGTTVTGTVTTTTITKFVGPTPTPTPVPDRTPPRVTLITDITKPFTEAPTITGKATDTSGVAAIDYSVDDGRNWLSVDTITTAGAATVSFAFTPIGLDDGNYILKMRGKDGKGNIGSGQSVTLVIDRLPPRIGASVVSLGPELLASVPGNRLVIPAGLRPKIFLSAVGGPTRIDLTETAVSPSSFKETVTLVKNVENGLWSAALNFPEPGVYELSTYAIDGAQNESTRALQTVVALPNGRITDEKGRAIAGATLRVYTFDAITSRYALWDGASYGQKNPQTTGEGGTYQLFLPAGTYYLEANAPGFRKLKTQIVSTNISVPVASDLQLTPGKRLRVGWWDIPLPDFGSTFAMISLEPPRVSQQTASGVIGREFPYFRLPMEGKTVSSTDVRGKPTVVTVLNTWWPQVGMQLHSLEELSKQGQINVLVLVPQESPSQVEIFRRRGGYSVPMVADKDGDLVDAIEYQGIPTHYFLTRKGIIGNVVIGMMGEKRLMDALVQ